MATLSSESSTLRLWILASALLKVKVGHYVYVNLVKRLTELTKQEQVNVMKGKYFGLKQSPRDLQV